MEIEVRALSQILIARGPGSYGTGTFVIGSRFAARGPGSCNRDNNTYLRCTLLGLRLENHKNNRTGHKVHSELMRDQGSLSIGTIILIIDNNNNYVSSKFFRKNSKLSLKVIVMKRISYVLCDIVCTLNNSHLCLWLSSQGKSFWDKSLEIKMTESIQVTSKSAFFKKCTFAKVRKNTKLVSYCHQTALTPDPVYNYLVTMLVTLVTPICHHIIYIRYNSYITFIISYPIYIYVAHLIRSIFNESLILHKIKPLLLYFLTNSKIIPYPVYSYEKGSEHSYSISYKLYHINTTTVNKGFTRCAFYGIIEIYSPGPWFPNPETGSGKSLLLVPEPLTVTDRKLLLVHGPLIVRINPRPTADLRVRYIGR